MKTLSATCVAIGNAIANNTLRVVENYNERLGCPYWSIEDDRGLIEVCLSAKEAADRVQEITLAIA